MGLDLDHDHDHGHHHHDHPEHDHEAERRTLIATTVVVGLLVGFDLLFAFLGLDSLRRPFGISLSLIAAVIGGGRVVYLAVSSLFEGRIGADIALAIACIAAGIAGRILRRRRGRLHRPLRRMPRSLHLRTRQRAIQALLEYRPRTARVLRDGEELEISADAVKVGDLLVVRPGERIAADGVVETGRSAVDQAILTGESLPVDKGQGDPVFTGTINQFGRIEVRAQRVGAETTMGRSSACSPPPRSKKPPSNAPPTATPGSSSPRS